MKIKYLLAVLLIGFLIFSCDGVTSVPGPKGETGEQGPVGLKGDKGDPGEKGETGLGGVDGKDGQNGQDGQSIVGPEGPQGLQGVQGAQGPKGDSYSGPAVLWTLDSLFISEEYKGKRLSIYDDYNDSGVLEVNDDFLLEQIDFRFGKTVGDMFQAYVKALNYIDIRFEYAEVVVDSVVVPDKYACEFYIDDGLVWEFVAVTEKKNLTQ